MKLLFLSVRELSLMFAWSDGVLTQDQPDRALDTVSETILKIFDVV